MHDSGSMLLTSIETVRMLLEQARIDKYTDHYIVQYIICPAYSEVLRALNMESDLPIVSRAVVSMVADTEYYELPPTMSEVLRVVRTDATGRVTSDLIPRGMTHPYDINWAVEGNLLRVSPKPTSAQDWTVYYSPSGDVSLHQGTGVYSVSATGEVTMAATPSVGVTDKRPNSYVGSVCRIFNAGLVLGERIIATHDAATNKITPRIPWPTGSTPAQGQPILYEIAPLGHRSVWNMISGKAALMLGEARGVDQAKIRGIDMYYGRAFKAAFDHVSNMQARVGKHFERFTIDNPEYGMFQWRPEAWGWLGGR